MENRKRTHDSESSQSSMRSVTNEISLSEATPKDVADYLRGKGYTHEAELFEEQEISGKVLADLTEDLLDKKIGVRSLGKRLELLNLFKELEGQKILKAGPVPAPSTSSSIHQQQPPTTPEPAPTTSSKIPKLTPSQAEKNLKCGLFGDEAFRQELLQKYHRLEQVNGADGKTGTNKQLVTVLYNELEQSLKNKYTFQQVYDVVRRLLKNENKAHATAAVLD